MEGAAASAAIEVVVHHLIDYSQKKFLLVQRLNKEAAKLTERMDALQKFLENAEMRTIPNDTVKRWLDMLKEATIEADNILDEFNYHLLCKQIKPIKPMKQKVPSCFSSCANISRSRNMALRIREINENLESIYKEGEDLGLKHLAATHEPTLPDATLETDSFTHDPIFIGRDDVVLEIVSN